MLNTVSKYVPQYSKSKLNPRQKPPKHSCSELAEVVIEVLKCGPASFFYGHFTEKDMLSRPFIGIKIV
jgi:hypothetical protein